MTQRKQPTSKHQATIFIHPGADQTGPLKVQLPGVVVTLLKRYERLQAFQRGETVLSLGAEDPMLSDLPMLNPGEQEACLTAAVGLCLKCAFRADDEVMIVTKDEAEAIRRERKRSGLQPLSQIRV